MKTSLLGSSEARAVQRSLAVPSSSSPSPSSSSSHSVKSSRTDTPHNARLGIRVVRLAHDVDVGIGVQLLQDRDQFVDLHLRRPPSLIRSRCVDRKSTRLNSS